MRKLCSHQSFFDHCPPGRFLGSKWSAAAREPHAHELEKARQALSKANQRLQAIHDTWSEPPPEERPAAQAALDAIEAEVSETTRLVSQIETKLRGEVTFPGEDLRTRSTPCPTAVSSGSLRGSTRLTPRSSCAARASSFAARGEGARRRDSSPRGRSGSSRRPTPSGSSTSWTGAVGSRASRSEQPCRRADVARFRRPHLGHAHREHSRQGGRSRRRHLRLVQQPLAILDTEINDSDRASVSNSAARSGSLTCS